MSEQLELDEIVEEKPVSVRKEPGPTAPDRSEEEAGEPAAPARCLPPVVSPLDLPTDIFAAGLARRKENRGAILGWIRESLVEGTDYGRIHVAGKDRCAYAKRNDAASCPTPSHWTKPSLFKPGAEKICGMLGVTAHYPNLGAYEDAALQGRVLGTIILRCELRDGQGHTVAEGIGARQVQQDFGDLNKSLKMAGKSAHIDATLRMAGLSEVFTQDLEDILMGSGTRVEAAPAVPSPESSGETVSDSQLKFLEERIRGLGLDRDRVVRWVKTASKDRIQGFDALTPEIYDRLIGKLDDWARPVAG